MKKLLCTVLSTVLAMSSAAALNMSAYADSTNTQQVSYNYWYNSSTGYTALTRPILKASAALMFLAV